MPEKVFFDPGQDRQFFSCRNYRCCHRYRLVRQEGGLELGVQKGCYEQALHLRCSSVQERGVHLVVASEAVLPCMELLQITRPRQNGRFERGFQLEFFFGGRGCCGCCCCGCGSCFKNF